MKFSYIEDVVGMKRNELKGFIVNAIEAERKKQRVSIKEIDKWQYGEKPTYTECLKDHSKINEDIVCTIFMGLKMCVDHIFAPVIPKTTSTNVKKLYTLLKYSKCPWNKNTLEKDYAMIIILGVLNELNESGF